MSASQRLFRRGFFQGGSVVAADVIVGSGIRSRVDKRDIGTLVVELTSIFVQLIDGKQRSVLSSSEAERGKVGSLGTVVSCTQSFETVGEERERVESLWVRVVGVHDVDVGHVGDLGESDIPTDY